MSQPSEINPDELENADIIVSLWAIDNGLERIGQVLDRITKMLENPPKEQENDNQDY
jgi:hypothetical protein